MNGMNGAAFKVVSADAGMRWALANIFGNPLFSYDNRKVTITPSYDKLQRVTQVHVQKPKVKGDPLELDHIVEEFIYGDQSDKARNLCGQLKKHYDQAGVSTVHSLTMGGEPLSAETQLRLDYKNEANWDDMSDLLSEPYKQKAKYGALGRVVTDTGIGSNG